MKNTDLLDSILDDNEKLAIQMFVDNDVQREAVRKIILSTVYYNGVLEKGKQANPTINAAFGLASNKEELHLSYEDLGKHLNTQWEAIRLLELAFSNFHRYQTVKKEKVEVKNQAR